MADLRLLNEEDIHKCSIGLGADCCIFLVVGSAGFECARDGSLHQTLIERVPRMAAKRSPIEDYPDCQLKK